MAGTPPPSGYHEAIKKIKNHVLKMVEQKQKSSPNSWWSFISITLARNKAISRFMLNKRKILWKSLLFEFFFFYAPKPSLPDRLAQMNIPIQRKQSACRYSIKTSPNPYPIKPPNPLLSKTFGDATFPMSLQLHGYLFFFLPNILYQDPPLFSRVLPLPVLNPVYLVELLTPYSLLGMGMWGAWLGPSKF